MQQSGVLEALVAETSDPPISATEASPAKFKFAVNSTIVEHSQTDQSKPGPTRRGIQSSSGAYWNNETDGMWTYKYDGAATNGMDVVILILWMTL